MIFNILVICFYLVQEFFLFNLIISPFNVHIIFILTKKGFCETQKSSHFISVLSSPPFVEVRIFLLHLFYIFSQQNRIYISLWNYK